MYVIGLHSQVKWPCGLNSWKLETIFQWFQMLQLPVSAPKVLRLPPSGASTPLSLHCLYVFQTETKKKSEKGNATASFHLPFSVYYRGAFLTLQTWWHLNHKRQFLVFWQWEWPQTPCAHTTFGMKGALVAAGTDFNASLGISSHFLWKRLDGQKNIPWCILVFKEIIPQPGWLLVSSAPLDPSHETKSDRSREPCPVRYGPGMGGGGGVSAGLHALMQI